MVVTGGDGTRGVFVVTHRYSYSTMLAPLILTSIDELPDRASVRTDPKNIKSALEARRNYAITRFFCVV